MDYIAICLKGLEEITEKETKGKTLFPGRIKFTGKIKDFKSTTTIYRLFKNFKFKEPDDILKEFKKIKIKIKKKFKVDCNRDGNHNFKSVDIEKTIGIYLQKNNYVLDFKEPETIIFVDIQDNNCAIGLLEKEDLQKRNYRIKLNPDTLSPCIAFGALKLIDYKKKDILIDPLCRDGIIVIEAALIFKGEIYGFDKNIRNARINSKLAKVKLNLSQNEIDWLDTKFKKNSVKVISYLPSVSKRHNENEVRHIYSELFHQFDYIVKDKIALILKKTELIKTCLENFKIIKELKVEVGSDNYNILVLKKSS